MLCYKDREFCTFWRECKHGASCDRALTPQVSENAKKAGLYIAVGMEKRSCFVQGRVCKACKVNKIKNAKKG